MNTERYFISFVEEGIFNPSFKDFVGGRIEVSDNELDVPYPVIQEIRFFTKDKDYWKFREKWNFKNVSKKQLDNIKEIVKSRFQVKDKDKK